MCTHCPVASRGCGAPKVRGGNRSARNRSSRLGRSLFLLACSSRGARNGAGAFALRAFPLLRMPLPPLSHSLHVCPSVSRVSVRVCVRTRSLLPPSPPLRCHSRPSSTAARSPTASGSATALSVSPATARSAPRSSCSSRACQGTARRASGATRPTPPATA